MMTKRKSMGLLNLISFIVMVYANYAAVTLPINGKTTGEISDMYDNMFTPASFTFSIWGLIYSLLLVFVLLQLKMSFSKEEGRIIVDKIGYLFFISCAANVSWLFAWHYNNILLSLGVMFILLLSLSSIYRHIYLEQSSKTKYCCKLVFSVYIGWISIATIANLNIFLISTGWHPTGFYEVLWTLLLVSTGLILALFYIFSNNDIFYAMVIAWALFGIHMARIYDGMPVRNPISLLSLIGILVISISIIYKLIRHKIY